MKGEVASIAQELARKLKGARRIQVRVCKFARVEGGGLDYGWGYIGSESTSVERPLEAYSAGGSLYDRLISYSAGSPYYSDAYLIQVTDGNTFLYDVCGGISLSEARSLSGI